MHTAWTQATQQTHFATRLPSAARSQSHSESVWNQDVLKKVGHGACCFNGQLLPLHTALVLGADEADVALLGPLLEVFEALAHGGKVVPAHVAMVHLRSELGNLLLPSKSTPIAALNELCVEGLDARSIRDMTNCEIPEHVLLHGRSQPQPLLQSDESGNPLPVLCE